MLIPRPETEILVETALKYVSPDKTVLDLCTGSGAIAIAVKKESGAQLVATDVSEGALMLAKKNAEINDADIEFIQSDMFEGLSDRKFDVILSNPPYVETDDIATLQKEVKDFEPHVALDGGKDGLDFYRIIAKKAAEHLNENGVLILECGENQAKVVAELLKKYKNVEIIKDLENVERIVKAEI